MKSKSLTIAAILSSTLIIVGVSGADDINLDKPRFKAGDCLVWTSPTSESSSVVTSVRLNWDVPAATSTLIRVSRDSWVSTI